MLRDLREGWNTLVSSPLLRGLTVVVGLWALAAGTFWGIGVVYALDELDSGEAGFGVVVALSAVGSLVGAAITRPLIAPTGIFAAASAGIAVSAVAVAALSLADHLLVAAGLLASAVGTRVTSLISAVPVLLTASLLPSLRRRLTEARARAEQPSGPVDRS